jgi:hypothetical protein
VYGACVSYMERCLYTASVCSVRCRRTPSVRYTAIYGMHIPIRYVLYMHTVFSPGISRRDGCGYARWLAETVIGLDLVAVVGIRGVRRVLCIPQVVAR